MAQKGGYYIEYLRDGVKQLAEVHYADQTKGTIGRQMLVCRLVDEAYKPQLDHLQKQHRVLIDQAVTRKMGHFD